MHHSNSFKATVEVSDRQLLERYSPYMYECSMLESYTLVPIQKLETVCLQVNVRNSIYVSVPVNSVEIE